MSSGWRGWWRVPFVLGGSADEQVTSAERLARLWSLCTHTHGSAASSEQGAGARQDEATNTRGGYREERFPLRRDGGVPSDLETTDYSSLLGRFRVVPHRAGSHGTAADGRHQQTTRPWS